MTDPTPETPFTVRDHLIAALSALQGTPGADLAQITAQLVAIQGTPAATLRQLETRLAAIETATDNTRAAVVAQETRLNHIQSALGAVPYEDLETASVRGLLNAILQGQNTQLYGRNPTGTSDQMSDGTIVSGGRLYASFDGPITGVTISAGGRDLTADWGDGWSAYIKTTDPAPQIAGATDVPNQWLTLAGSGTINFSVGAAYTISVFLRDPGIPTEPVLLWSGDNAAPVQNLRPDALNDWVYFYLDLPAWADRLQVRIGTTNCAGNFAWNNGNDEGMSYLSGGCRDTTLAIPLGAAHAYANGNSTDRATGSIWALAPGVDPVPSGPS